jgi:peptidylprolyl isomerase
MKTCCALLAVVSGLVLFGCGNSSDPATSTRTSPEPEASSTTASAEPKAAYPVPRVPPQKEPLEKLVVKNAEQGTGPVARWGDEVEVRYVGVYYDSGESYSDHWGSTYDFELDGETIGPGWQKGIHGMRVGGRRELLIPSRLIFEGSDGDLAYVVNLLRVNRGAKKGQRNGEADKPASNSYEGDGPFAAITAKKGADEPVIDPADRPAPKRLIFRELEEGLGPAARRGDEVAIRYAGAMHETGEIRYGGTTRLFQLGSGGLGGAFERGLVGMRAGGRRELIVPSRLLGGSGAVDYMIELTGFKPTSPQR